MKNERITYNDEELYGQILKLQREKTREIREKMEETPKRRLGLAVMSSKAWKGEDWVDTSQHENALFTIICMTLMTIDSSKYVELYFRKQINRENKIVSSQCTSR